MACGRRRKLVIRLFRGEKIDQEPRENTNLQNLKSKTKVLFFLQQKNTISKIYRSRRFWHWRVVLLDLI